MKKKIIMALVAILIVIQFIRPEKNQASIISDNDISKAYANMPNEINVLLQKKCYDCHSNNTVYPWYSNIQPLGWWLASHVNEGKEHLNFSDFKSYDIERANHKLEEIVEEVMEGEMPLKSYTMIHGDAIVTDDEKQALKSWVASLGAQVEAHEADH